VTAFQIDNSRMFRDEPMGTDPFADLFN